MKTINKFNFCSIITTSVVIILTAIACTSKKVSENASIGTMKHFCVAIDLSDRIDDTATIEKDIIAIKHVFDSFEKRIRAARYVKCKDKFSVVLIPQEGQRNEQELFKLIDEMSIDMRAIPANKRFKCFENFKKIFEQNLRSIYHLAKQPTFKEYKGCNVWKFFNDQLPDIIDNDMNIELVLLTDGYIEIDNKNEIFERNGQINHMNSNVMTQLRKNDHWQQHSCDILLVPERLSNNRNLSKLNVVLVGLAPHNTYPYEVQLLEKIWENFFQRISLNYKIIFYINGISVVSQNLSDALI